MPCSHVRKKNAKKKCSTDNLAICFIATAALSLCNNELFTIGGIDRFTWGTTFADKPGTHPHCVFLSLLIYYTYTVSFPITM